MSDGLPRVSFTLRGRFYSVNAWADSFFAFERRKRSHPYGNELQASPHLAEMLREHGVNHICEAAGLTVNERDAVLLRAGGKSWGEIAEAFAEQDGKSHDRRNVRTFAERGTGKLVHTYRTLPMEGSTHVA